MTFSKYTHYYAGIINEVHKWFKLDNANYAPRFVTMAQFDHWLRPTCILFISRLSTCYFVAQTSHLLLWSNTKTECLNTFSVCVNAIIRTHITENSICNYFSLLYMCCNMCVNRVSFRGAGRGTLLPLLAPPLSEIVVLLFLDLTLSSPPILKKNYHFAPLGTISKWKPGVCSFWVTLCMLSSRVHAIYYCR